MTQYSGYDVQEMFNDLFNDDLVRAHDDESASWSSKAVCVTMTAICFGEFEVVVSHLDEQGKSTPVLMMELLPNKVEALLKGVIWI